MYNFNIQEHQCNELNGMDSVDSEIQAQFYVAFKSIMIKAVNWLLM